MSKVMFVTVGTSLFHSASWKPEALTEAPYYREWTQDDEKINTLRSPEARKRTRNAERIEKALAEGLRKGDYDCWTKRLPDDLLSGTPYTAEVMRYSAELATIIKTWNLTSNFPTFSVFLKSYSKIHLFADPASELPFHAAHHLAHTLNAVAKDAAPAEVTKVYGLSSNDPDLLLGNNTGLDYLARIILGELPEADQMDLVISGGYKLYGITLTPLLRIPEKRVRLLYIHEEGNRLIQVPKRLKEPAKSSGPEPETFDVDLLEVGMWE